MYTTPEERRRNEELYGRTRGRRKRRRLVVPPDGCCRCCLVEKGLEKKYWSLELFLGLSVCKKCVSKARRMGHSIMAEAELQRLERENCEPELPKQPRRELRELRQEILEEVAPDLRCPKCGAYKPNRGQLFVDLETRRVICNSCSRPPTRGPYRAHTADS